jgi:hypothetical protein
VSAKRKGRTDAMKASMAPTDWLAKQSAQAAEVANYERLKASRPLKPPGRR